MHPDHEDLVENVPSLPTSFKMSSGERLGTSTTDSRPYSYLAQMRGETPEHSRINIATLGLFDLISE